MFDPNNPEIQFAIHAARQAALLVRQVQQELVASALLKADSSPVTVADYAAQALVGRLLMQSFPQDALVAEEDSSVLADPHNEPILELVTCYTQRLAPEATPGEVRYWIDFNRADGGTRFWTLDPIDGTKGFLRGEQYAVALALVVAGVVRLGVLACPNLARASQAYLGGAGSLVVGVRGLGAWTTSLLEADAFEPLQVSTVTAPASARLLRSVESGHTNIDQVDRFAAALGIKTPSLSMDSQAKYALLAAGQGELYLRLLSPARPDYREKIWDQAAGSIIIEEAGGQVTDLSGRPLDFTTGRLLANNRGILASNRVLHPLALQALREIGA